MYGLSAHRKRPFCFLTMSIPQDDLGKEVIEIVGIHQPTPLHRKQKLHREYHPDRDAETQCLHRALHG